MIYGIRFEYLYLLQFVFLSICIICNFNSVSSNNNLLEFILDSSLFLVRVDIGIKGDLGETG